MGKTLQGRMLENFEVNINDFTYQKDQVVEITEFENFKNSYGVYHVLPTYSTMDWIPKNLVQLL